MDDSIDCTSESTSEYTSERSSESKIDNLSKIINNIEAIYESVDIYRSLLIYDKDIYEETLDVIKQALISKDFSFIEDRDGKGRIYLVSSDQLSDDELTSTIDYIDWNTINVVICMGEVSTEIGEYFYDANENIQHIYRVD